jgi:hypothetical protein
MSAPSKQEIDEALRFARKLTRILANRTDREWVEHKALNDIFMSYGRQQVTDVMYVIDSTLAPIVDRIIATEDLKLAMNFYKRMPATMESSRLGLHIHLLKYDS